MTSSGTSSGIWTRVRAFTRGERDAEMLYAYRRAGAGLHPMLDAAERRRLDLTLSGTSPFGMTSSTGLELACAWNAFALQTLADQLLQADEAADPGTVGFVPPVTFDQAEAYYRDVQRWLAHATRAAHDPQFTLPYGTLPARLPAWSPVEPCPRPHLDAMLAALNAMRLHVEAALHHVEQATPEADAQRLARLSGEVQEALVKARYAADMFVPGASDTLHEQIETYAKEAIEALYRAGQVLGDPGLLEPSRTPTTAQRPSAAALPGQPGFDPWVMTDPASVDSLRRNVDAARVIAEMWALDPDPAASLALWSEIQAALQSGGAAPARQPNGAPLGFYFCTPYCAVYEAQRPLMIGDTPIPRGQRFTLECAAEGVRIGYPFKREVVLGQFKPATIDYCDPDQPPPHE
jgi:hypothetical protein